MAVNDVLNLAQQENILAILAHSDKYGKIVAQSVDPALFEGDYRTIAERCVEYWRENQTAPKVHTHDLFTDYLETQHKRSSTYRSILNDMARLAEDVNGDYVIRNLSQFTRLQKLKDAIIQAAERINQPTPATIPQVEEILGNILRARDFQFDAGMRLRDIDRLINYLGVQYSEFDTGIAEFDDHNIVPHRTGVMLFLGGKGRGKTWWLVNLGKRAILRRKKVVHISLEMGEEEVTQRYLQAFFSMPKRMGEQAVTALRLKESDRGLKLIGFKRETIQPELSFDYDDLKMELEARTDHLGAKLDNIRIKRFPAQSLSPDGLRAFLDSLESVENFIPDLVILDYIGIMRTDTKDYRHSLGRNMQEFRAIMTERNCAGVTAAQISKEGFNAKRAKSTNVGEDWSLIHTADITLAHSATELERRYGLGRLSVEHARGESDNFGVLITQNYGIGQFVLQSVRLPSDYYDLWDEFKEEEGATEEGDEDKDED